MVIKRELIIFKRTAEILLFFCSITGFTQTKNHEPNYSFPNQVKISVSGLIYNKLEIENTGKPLLESRPCLSGEAILSYYQYFGKGLGLNVGLGLGIGPFNYNYHFKSPDGSIYQTGPYKDDYEYLFNNVNNYSQDLLVFPLSLQKEISFKKKDIWFLNLELGLKLNMKIAYPYEISFNEYYVIDDSTEVTLLDLYLYDTGQRNFISYFFKIGLLKQTKNNNFLIWNLVLHYSPQNIGNGWYEFYELNYESYGSVYQNINYIGIEFVIGLGLQNNY